MKKILFFSLSLLIVSSSNLLSAEQMVVKEQRIEKTTSMRADLKEISHDFNALFPGPYSLSETEVETIRDKKVPQLMSNGEVLNSSEKVAEFATKHDVHVAVLVKQGDDYTIVASNLKKSNDMSVNGLKLDHETSAYKNLSSDLGFHGKISLWGKEYTAKVDPLKNKKGKIVGALLVALPVAGETVK